MYRVPCSVLIELTFEGKSARQLKVRMLSLIYTLIFMCGEKAKQRHITQDQIIFSWHTSDARGSNVR